MNLLRTTNAAGATNQRFTDFADSWGGLTSLRDTTTGLTSHYAFDMSGNTRDLVNASGAVTDQYWSTAFGSELNATGSTNNPFRFSGEVGGQRQAADMTYLRARVLEMLHAIWLSKDPIGFYGGDWNLSRYVGNNPIDHIDPSGQISCAQEEKLKYLGVKAWSEVMVTDPAWQTILWNWYYEKGPDPVTYTGFLDPRNSSLNANVGFTKLLECWAAAFYNGATPPRGRWAVTSSGFQWQYTYFRLDAAGQNAAYDSATELLGSYSVDVSPVTYFTASQIALVQIHAYNVTGWHSGTRFPFGMGYIWPDHPRGNSRCSGRGFPSTGGNLTENFIFGTTVNVPCKCNLP